MKVQRAIPSWYLLASVLFFYFSNSAVGQGLDLVAGASAPEGFFAGIRFTEKQTQTGFNVGTLPTASDRSFFSVSGEFLYHFSRENNDSSKIKSFYTRAGINYVRNENMYRINKNIYLNARVGRAISLGSNWGIGIDGGLFFRMSHREAVKQEHSGLGLNFGFLEDLDFLEYVSPAIGLSIYYQL